MIQNKKLNIPKIIGHRGVKCLAPENTLQSINKAFNFGIKWIEVDVKISKDHIPFLMHDDYLERTTTGFGLACKLNYSQIKNLDAGKFFYNKKTKIYPPTLEEVLNFCKINHIGINIELKPNIGLEIENVDAILKITKNYSKSVPLYFSSFDLQSCIDLKKKSPDALC